MARRQDSGGPLAAPPRAPRARSHHPHLPQGGQAPQAPPRSHGDRPSCWHLTARFNAPRTDPQPAAGSSRHLTVTCEGLTECLSGCFHVAALLCSGQIGMMICAKALPDGKAPLDTRTPRQPEPTHIPLPEVRLASGDARKDATVFPCILSPGAAVLPAMTWTLAFAAWPLLVLQIGGLQYYSHDVHRSAFTLPKFAKDALAGSLTFQ